jgi:nucleoside-diphosphate-sugar epimerase
LGGKTVKLDGISSFDIMSINKTKKILVTGGGGFLGGAIVRRLVEKGHVVTSISRNLYPKLTQLGVRQIQGDIGDENTVERACEGINFVFHVAAKTGIWGPYQEYFHTNVTGTQNILAASQKKSVSGVVYTSSPSVVFDGSDMEGVDESVPYPTRYLAYYPKTKAMAERSVLQATHEGLQAIILRPHLVWGPEDTALVPRIIARADRLRIIGNGNNLVDTVYIDNAADAHILAADRLMKNPQLSGNIYFISQGNPIVLWEMVNRILDAASLPPVKRSISRPMAWWMGAFLEMFYKTFRIRKEPQMTRFLAEELATAHWFNIDAAKRDLGYFPRVSIEEGLQRLREWFSRKASSF